MTDADLDDVLRLNNASTPAVNALAAEELARLHGLAKAALTAVHDDALAGFCLVYGPGEDYASLNYRWFTARFTEFAYLDRIAVAPFARRLGVARALYGEVFSSLAGRWPLLCCEVNIRPRNQPSLDLHASLGFVEVGQQDTDGGAKTVQMLTHPL